MQARDAAGYTPLMWAAIHGDIAMVLLLMNHGADPRIHYRDSLVAEPSTARDLALLKASQVKHPIKQVQYRQIVILLQWYEQSYPYPLSQPITDQLLLLSQSIAPLPLIPKEEKASAPSNTSPVADSKQTDTVAKVESEVVDELSSELKLPLEAALTFFYQHLEFYKPYYKGRSWDLKYYLASPTIKRKQTKIDLKLSKEEKRIDLLLRLPSDQLKALVKRSAELGFQCTTLVFIRRCSIPSLAIELLEVALNAAVATNQATIFESLLQLDICTEAIKRKVFFSLLNDSELETTLPIILAAYTPTAAERMQAIFALVERGHSWRYSARKIYALLLEDKDIDLAHRDSAGHTALTYAAHKEQADPRTVNILLWAGFDPTLTYQDKTPYEIAKFQSHYRRPPRGDLNQDNDQKNAKSLEHYELVWRRENPKTAAATAREYLQQEEEYRKQKKDFLTAAQDCLKLLEIISTPPAWMDAKPLSLPELTDLPIQPAITPKLYQVIRSYFESKSEDMGDKLLNFIAEHLGSESIAPKESKEGTTTNLGETIAAIKTLRGCLLTYSGVTRLDIAAFNRETQSVLANVNHSLQEYRKSVTDFSKDTQPEGLIAPRKEIAKQLRWARLIDILEREKGNVKGVTEKLQQLLASAIQFGLDDFAYELIKAGAVVHEDDLMIAATADHCDLMKTLLRHFPDITDEQIQRIFYAAVKAGAVTTAKVIQNELCFDVNTPNLKGHTCLMRAQLENDAKVTAILTQVFGANPNTGKKPNSDATANQAMTSLGLSIASGQQDDDEKAESELAPLPSFAATTDQSGKLALVN